MCKLSVSGTTCAPPARRKGVTPRKRRGYQPFTLSIYTSVYRDWKSYHLETVLLNVLDSGALVAITTTPVDPGSYQVSEMPALSTAVTAGSRRPSVANRGSTMTAGKDRHTTGKGIVSSISGKCGLCRCGSIPPQCSFRCVEITNLMPLQWRIEETK